MRTMSQEEALREGLKYVADCLERREIYQVSNDSFVRGDPAISLIADFARKLAEGKLPKWIEWCEKRKSA